MPNIVMADQPSGQDIVKLAEGTYVKASNGTTMSISVTYTGTPLYANCHETEAVSATARSISWQGAYNVQRDIDYEYSYSKYGIVRSEAANGTHPSPAFSSITLSETSLQVNQQSSAYPILANSYHWEIWGVK